MIIETFVCFSAGIISGAAAAAFLIALGIFSKMCNIAGGKEFAAVYSRTCFFGVVTGSVASIIRPEFFDLPFLFTISMVFSGCFVGILIFSISEVFSILPLIYKKEHSRAVLLLILIVIAVGRIIGALIDFFV